MSFFAPEWLSEAAGKDIRVQIVGSARAMIENHGGIAEFTDQIIRLSASEGCVAVRGQHLTLRQVSPSALIVEGKIEAVALPGAREGEDDGSR